MIQGGAVLACESSESGCAQPELAFQLAHS